MSDKTFLEWSWCNKEMREQCENYGEDCDHCTRNLLAPEFRDCFRPIEEEEGKGEGK